MSDRSVPAENEPSIHFDHVAQVVPDIGVAVSWYGNVVPGTRVLYQDSTWAFIEAAGVKIAFVVRDRHPGHIAWRVSEARLDALAAEHNAEVKPHRDGTRSFYLDAPGGHSVEIISVEGSAWEQIQETA